MKRFLGMAVLLLAFAGMASAEVKLDSLVWLDYQNTTVTNTNITLGNQFFIERAYVNFRGDIGSDPWGSKLKTRMTLDFAKATSSSANGLLKYAYVDYDILGWKAFIVSAGIIKTQFGNIGFWEYPIPIKDATEAYKDNAVVFPGDWKPSGAAVLTNTNTYKGFSVPSADFGVALSGYLLPIEGMTKNLFMYDLEVNNGEGYDSLFNEKAYNNNLFCSQGSLFVMPLDGTRIGGSARFNPSLNSTGQLVYNNSYAFVLAAQDVQIGDFNLPIDFVFQYILNNVTVRNGADQDTTNALGNNNYNQSIVSATLGYGLFDKVLTPYVRYDIVNASDQENATNATTTGTTGAINNNVYKYSVFYAGINFMPTKNFMIKPIYWYNLGDNSYAWKVQLEYKLSLSVWQ